MGQDIGRTGVCRRLTYHVEKEELKEVKHEGQSENINMYIQGKKFKANRKQF